MPIHACTLQSGKSGYQWGGHGKCYASRADAERQAAAIHASGWAGKLLKARLAKGDVPGHEFHGNQYGLGSGAHVQATKDWKNWADNLSKEDQQILDRYQAGELTRSDEGQSVNEQLREGAWSNDAKRLSNALSNAVAPRNLILYRGVSDQSNFVTADSYKDKGFMSTTLSSEHATSIYADTEMYDKPQVLELHVPKGTHGVAYLDAQHGGKWSGGEGEVLLDKGMLWHRTATRTDSEGRQIVTLHLKANRNTKKINLRSLLFKNLDRAAHTAATSPHNLKRPPTKAEAKAGNYPKGHVRFAGLDVSIENPAGSRRRPEWPPMQAHYGYIRGTAGADGEHVDCFLRPATPLDWDGEAYVIDQVNADGGFDEHKIMLGWDSQSDAEKAYLSHYPKGFRLGQVTAMSLDELKAWLGGDTTEALGKGDVPGHEFHGNQYQAGAEKIKAMSQDARDNLNPADAPGGWGAYNLYEAQTMLPKASDKLKTVTEKNSFTLHQDYHQIANVDGTHYGISHYDDPDNAEGQEESKDEHIFAYHRLDDPRSAMTETTIGANKANVAELITHIRSNATKTTKINLRSLLIKGDVAGHEFHGNQWTAVGGGDVYHGTSKENAARIKEVGFMAGVGTGMSSTSANLFSFVTPSKASAAFYSKQNIRHAVGEVVPAKLTGRVLELSGRMPDYRAYGEVRDRLGLPTDSKGAYDESKIAQELSNRGYVGFSFKDSLSGGRVSIAVIPAALKANYTKVNLRSLLLKEEGSSTTTTTGHTQSSSATSGITAYGMIRNTLRRKLKAKEKRAWQRQE